MSKITQGVKALGPLPSGWIRDLLLALKLQELKTQVLGFVAEHASFFRGVQDNEAAKAIVRLLSIIRDVIVLVWHMPSFWWSTIMAPVSAFMLAGRRNRLLVGLLLCCAAFRRDSFKTALVAVLAKYAVLYLSSGYDRTARHTIEHNLLDGSVQVEHVPEQLRYTDGVRSILASLLGLRPLDSIGARGSRINDPTSAQPAPAGRVSRTEESFRKGGVVPGTMEPAPVVREQLKHITEPEVTEDDMAKMLRMAGSGSRAPRPLQPLTRDRKAKGKAADNGAGIEPESESLIVTDAQMLRMFGVDAEDLQELDEAIGSSKTTPKISMLSTLTAALSKPMQDAYASFRGKFFAGTKAEALECAGESAVVGGAPIPKSWVFSGTGFIAYPTDELGMVVAKSAQLARVNGVYWTTGHTWTNNPVTATEFNAIYAGKPQTISIKAKQFNVLLYAVMDDLVMMHFLNNKVPDGIKNAPWAPMQVQHTIVIPWHAPENDSFVVSGGVYQGMNRHNADTGPGWSGGACFQRDGCGAIHQGAVGKNAAGADIGPNLLLVLPHPDMWPQFPGLEDRASPKEVPAVAQVAPEARKAKNVSRRFRLSNKKMSARELEQLLKDYPELKAQYQTTDDGEWAYNIEWSDNDTEDDRRRSDALEQVLLGRGHDFTADELRSYGLTRGESGKVEQLAKKNPEVAKLLDAHNAEIHIMKFRALAQPILDAGLIMPQMVEIFVKAIRDRVYTPELAHTMLLTAVGESATYKKTLPAFAQQQMPSAVNFTSSPAGGVQPSNASAGALVAQGNPSQNQPKQQKSRGGQQRSTPSYKELAKTLASLQASMASQTSTPSKDMSGQAKQATQPSSSVPPQGPSGSPASGNSS